jgi:hypothetical protein
MIATPQPQNMLLPLSPWHNNLTMMSQFWWNFWPTHANFHTSIDRAQPALLTNSWQLAQGGWNGHQKTFAQAAMQGCWVLHLSHVQNIKKYFINNICFVGTRFYIIITILGLACLLFWRPSLLYWGHGAQRHDPATCICQQWGIFPPLIFHTQTWRTGIPLPLPHVCPSSPPSPPPRLPIFSCLLCDYVRS